MERTPREMPLAGQIPHWGGSEQKCCCFPSRAEGRSPVSLDRRRRLHHCDKLVRPQREAQERSNRAAVPS